MVGGSQNAKLQGFAAVSSILLALTLAGPAQAQDRAGAASPGFYGGVSMREGVTEGTGITFGSAAAAWSHLSVPTSDDTSPRSVVFGGYRWSNDVAVEASFSSSDKYALRPADMAGPRRGVGLNFGSGALFSDIPARSWNLDVYTSWNFYKAFALYGRMGYAQNDGIPVFAPSTQLLSDPRRARDGVNYGLGVRYDMNSALGLRLEYGRFGRFIGEIGNGLPETDQVTFGIQFRF